MNKKFELIKNDSIEMDGHKLYRIRALIDFRDIKAGDLGGYVENENNLSQIGNCWIYDNAKVYGNASVFDSARVFGNACISGDASIEDNAYVGDSACISDNAKVYDSAYVSGNVCVCGDAYVCGNANVYDNAYISGSAYIYDNARVIDNPRIFGSASIFGNAHISGDAIIKSDDDYIVFKNSWSSGRYFTYTKSNKMWRVGCFYGDGDELIQKAYADSENSGKHYEVYVNLVREIEKLDNKND